MSQETQTADPVLPDYWSWEASGAPANIRVNLDVVDALSADVIQGFNALPRRGVEVGGMLVGRRDADTVYIERFESVPCEYRFGPSYILSDQDKREFEARRAAIERDGQDSILGFYRSHTRRDLQLEPSDLEVIQRWFDDPASLFLVVKPLDISHLVAEFFFFHDGKLRMESAGREFPFKGRGFAAIPTPKPPPFAAPARSAATPAGEVPAKQIPPPRPEPPRRPPPTPAFTRPAPRGFFAKYWEAIAALFLVLCAAGLFWWQHSGSDDSDTADQPAPATTPAPASLGLDVKPDAGVWHVTWNPGLPLIEGAGHGVLTIEDGSLHNRVPLDRNQLRSGGVPYRHMGDDVSFRLQIFGPGNKSSSESYRVLLAARPKKFEPPPTKLPEKAAASASVPAKPAPAPLVGQPKATHRLLIPAEAVRRVQPEITEGIRSRISQEMTIIVKIDIDEKGRVTHAAPVTRGDGLTSYLSSRAGEAALKWQFEPAHEDGRAVASSQVIRFVFEQ